MRNFEKLELALVELRMQRRAWQWFKWGCPVALGDGQKEYGITKEGPKEQAAKHQESIDATLALITDSTTEVQAGTEK